MSSVPTVVDVEAGSPLEGLTLSRVQKLKLYTDGFVVLKGVVPKEMCAKARRRIFEPTDEERERGVGNLGSAPEITDLINKSRFTDVIQDTIGEFDPPQSTQVGVTGVAASTNVSGDKGFNLVGYREEGFPYYNATIHMDGLTTCAQLHTDDDGVAVGTPEEVYLNYINGPWSKHGVNGRIGRHAENYGGNGGMLFMDEDNSLTTGSFTAFAVVCLNDQTEPGRGQFTVLRGCHHAMGKFYQMQQQLGGIVGPVRKCLNVTRFKIGPG
jgi:hypothetical protein